MDYEGTEEIKKYFGGEIYKFTISDALHRRHGPKNEPFLTPYEYYPIKVNLTEEENENKSLANNCEDKYKQLSLILDKLKEENKGLIDHLIIFCSDIQLPIVLEILDQKQIKPKHEFTYRQNLKVRKKLLNDFDKGIQKVLVAMKCLNEGVDVPSTDKVIIMSSSSNPAEYIQRRGRVLRKSPGKTKAQIYDLIVIPNKNNKLNYLNKEIKRLIEFISTSCNADEHMDLMKKWGLI